MSEEFTFGPLPPPKDAPSEKLFSYRKPAQQSLGARGWLFVSIFAAAVAFMLHNYLLGTYKIPTESMVPTLQVGDYILVNRIAYQDQFGGSQPQRGDIVVFSAEHLGADGERRKQRTLIKRVAAVPGDRVESVDLQLTVNGQTIVGKSGLIPPDAIPAAARTPKHIMLGAGEYFMLGDNFSNSEDSRVFGTVRAADIIGKAVFIYWSWFKTKSGFEIRWGRIGQALR